MLTTAIFISGLIQEDSKYSEQAHPTEVSDLGQSDAGINDRHRKQAQRSHRLSIWKGNSC